MTMIQLKDILYEKRKVDKANQELENKIERETKGHTDSDAKERQIDAEKSQMKKLKVLLQFMDEKTANLLELLKDEETKAKDMLDEKIALANEMNLQKEILNEEKLT